MSVDGSDNRARASIGAVLSPMPAESGSRREDHILAGAIRLHYMAWGRGDRRAIVFLHAGGSSAHSWDAVCAQLQVKHLCLAIDLRGHGDSEWALDADYSLEANSRDLAAFIRALRLSSFALVGASFGALVALQFVGDGGTPDGLVIVDSGPAVNNAETRRMVQSLNGIPADFGSVEEYVEYALRENPRRDPEKIRQRYSQSLRRLSNARWAWKFDRRNYAQVDQPAFEERRKKLWTAVEAARCPALVVRGGESNLFSEDQAAGLARRFPRGSWVVAEGAKHSVESHDAAALAKIIDEFLTRVV